MMKLLKSRAFIGLACMALAGVVAFGVLPGFYAAQAETTTVVKVARDIPPGTAITAELLTASEVGAYGLPESVVKTKADAVGKVAAEPLYTGELLTAARLITQEEYTAREEAATKGLREGDCLVSIQFPRTSAGIAGVLRSGHMVDVHECIEDTETEAVTVQKVLDSLYVYDVLNARLESLSALDKQKAETEEESVDYDFVPTIVVLRCTEAQAQTLIRLERMEALHLTLQRTGG